MVCVCVSVCVCVRTCVYACSECRVCVCVGVWMMDGCRGVSVCMSGQVCGKDCGWERYRMYGVYSQQASGIPQSYNVHMYP